MLPLNRKLHFIASNEHWLEELGEVELIGGWAEVALDADFDALVESADYQVFLTSYDAVLLFVQNRTARSFEIYALPALNGKRQFSTRCGFHPALGSSVAMRAATKRTSLPSPRFLGA